MYSYPSTFVTSGQGLFFFVQNGYSRELWRTDGTQDGTLLVRYIIGAYPGNLTAVGDLVFFTTELNGQTLWKSDGTESGTMQIRSFDARPEQLTAVGNRLFFRIEIDYSTVELWTSDGTRDGTVRLLEPSPSWMAPDQLFGVDDRLLFSASAGEPFLPGQRQLWRTDGTEQGTQPILDVTARDFVQVGPRLYFGGDDGIHGDELWIGYAAILAGQPLAALWDLRSELDTLDAPIGFTRGLSAKIDAAVTAFEAGDREAAKEALRTVLRQLGAARHRRSVPAVEELSQLAREVLELLDSE
jgi:ELWxxDGT repeat protein